MDLDLTPHWDGSLLKALGSYTWPGIELGHAPTFKHSFFEYVDALRLGELEAFQEIEAESGDWWFPTLDRGSGACLHFAVDHGQLEAVRFLVEERGAEINQQDLGRGWTPLMRCAQMAHYTHKPYRQVFECLLQHGADPELQGRGSTLQAKLGAAAGVLDVAVTQGRGWKVGEVKAMLAELIARYQSVPKKPAYIYEGPPIGPTAAAVLEAWERLPPGVPPQNWRPPPPAGFQGAQGMRLAAEEPWRPAGDNDGSCFVRPMTEAELAVQSKSVQAAG